MQLSSSRSRGPLWRKLFVALLLVTLVTPILALPADASAANQLTVRINSPKTGDTINGFINISFAVNPIGQLAVPVRRENTNLRTWGIYYAPGQTTNPADFTAWYFDSWQYRGGVAAAGNARANRDTYIAPGFGSIRPPRAGGKAFNTTILPDGPATLDVRGFAMDGTTKDAFVTVNIKNNGAQPSYTDFVKPLNGDTVSGWVPLVLTAMPRRNGIGRGILNTPWVSFLPSCLDIDINYAKVEYAAGLTPEDSELVAWWYSDYGTISYHEWIPQDGKSLITPAGCPGSPVYIYNGGPFWNSTLVPDGPATLKYTVVFNDGGLKQYYRVVNVANNGAGVQYFGLDHKALTAKPASGDAFGIPGIADVPYRGIPKWTYELPTAYFACDVAAGDQLGTPQDQVNWTFFWANDNDTYHAVWNADGFTVGGETRMKDWTANRSYGPSGGLCRLDTTTIPNGVYTIRLREQLTDGSTLSDMEKITVQN